MCQMAEGRATCSDRMGEVSREHVTYYLSQNSRHIQWQHCMNWMRVDDRMMDTAMNKNNKMVLPASELKKVPKVGYFS